MQAKSLRNILNMTGTAVAELGFDFDGLKQDGALIGVTDENKYEFVDLSVYDLLVGSRLACLNELKAGFGTVDLSEYLNRFCAADLMLVVNGEEKIDPVQIISALQFTGFERSPTPAALVTVLKELSQRDLRRFLRLATAQCSVPQGGLDRKIIIQMSGNISKLPVGHTCTLTIDMPDYQHIEVLRPKLLLALENVDAAGFDFV